MRVVDVKWYHSCIGIVLVDTEFGHKAYIGVGFGLNEATDIDYITRTGGRFYDAPALWTSVVDWAS